MMTNGDRQGRIFEALEVGGGGSIPYPFNDFDNYPISLK